MLNASRPPVLIVALTCLTSCFCLGPARAQHKSAGQTHPSWSGDAGSFRWKWTKSDLTAKSSSKGTIAFSALAFEKQTSEYLKDRKTNPSKDYFEVSIRPLSVVGNITSYERDYYWEGGAHPSGSIDYVTMDASRPSHPLKLNDLFPESDILKALLADRVVHGTLERNKIAADPKTTSELVTLLSGKTFGGVNNEQFQFEKDLLSRFAFYGVEGNRVAARLNVSWSFEVFHFSTTQIGILLPIPSRLKSALTDAQSRRHGFLMRDSNRLASGRKTVLISGGTQR